MTQLSPREHLRLAAAAVQLGVWRFRTLDSASRALRGISVPILRRPFGGATLVVDTRRSNVQRLLYFEGERFVAERHLLRRLLRSGMRAVDVGANIGYYLLLMRQAVGSGGRVDCFEPEPDNVVELERNVVANRFENVQIFPIALGDATGEANLSTGINGSLLGDTDSPLRVVVQRLDDAIPGPVDFLKVDVEGYEAHVLRGARHHLESTRPVLLVEVHPWLLPTGESVDELLAGLEELYGTIELHELNPQRSTLAKIAARYLGRGVQRIRDRQGLVAECRKGRRDQPFWLVAGARA